MTPAPEQSAAGGEQAATPSLRFEMLGQRVRVQCDAPVLTALIASNFASLADASHGAPADLHYRVDVPPGEPGFVLTRADQPSQRAADAAELLFVLEKDVTVALQQHRPDLLFLHAAALEFQGRAYLLAGDSGNGKSTTAWGLLHHGFRYLSDELAPIELVDLTVHAYPHALCMKRRPPAAYPLPSHGVIDLGATLHVPTASLPGALATPPVPLAALLFVRHDAGRATPSLHPIGVAEAAARLYVSTLNALAHPAYGLDAVLRVARAAPGFVLHTAELGASCQLVCRWAAGASNARATCAPHPKE